MVPAGSREIPVEAAFAMAAEAASAAAFETGLEVVFGFVFEVSMAAVLG